MPERSAPRLHHLGLCLTMAAGLCACATSPTPAPSEPERTPTPATAAHEPLDGLDEELESLRSSWNAPGLAVAVVDGDQIVYARGFGQRNLESGEPVDADTVFQVASNTKPMFGAVVSALDSEGAIDLDARVVEVLPDFRLADAYATKQIRVGDLLAHNSGLATFAGDLMWIGSEFDSGTVMARLRHIEPAREFRSGFGYTNLMFMVAGEVVRTKTKRPWDAHVRERILEPLEMSRTSTNVAALDRIENVATPYMEVDGEQVGLPPFSFDTVGPAGSVNSSANDMARWVMLHLGEGEIDGRRILPADVLAATYTPRTLRKSPTLGDDTGRRHFRTYGLGWFVSDYAGRLMIDHGGGAPGTTSKTVILPEAGIGVVAMTNSETPVADLAALIVVDRLLGLEGVDWNTRAKERASPGPDQPAPQAAPVPAADLRPLVGTYENPALGRAKVLLEGGTLHLHLSDHGGLHCPMTPIRIDEFRCIWSDPAMTASPVSFARDGGRIRSLSFSVRPHYIDPVRYEFQRERGRKR